MKKILWFIIIACTVGCASRSERLSREYDLMSQQIEALEEERAEIVKLRFAAKSYLKAREEYSAQKESLTQIKQRHIDRGLPTGSPLEQELGLEEEIPLLEKHESVLSDEIRALEKKRAEIVSDQMQQ